jgi:hypothetical protein
MDVAECNSCHPTISHLFLMVNLGNCRVLWTVKVTIIVKKLGVMALNYRSVQEMNSRVVKLNKQMTFVERKRE